MSISNLQDILKFTSITVDTLFDTLCKQFHAIYLLDLTQDKFFSIRDYHAEEHPEETDDAECTKHCKTYLQQFIHTTIHENYHAQALKFFNPETIASSFKTMSDFSEFVFCQRNGHWKKAILRPVITENSITTVALLMIIDDTKTQLQYDEFWSNTKSLQKQANHYQNLFFHAAMDTYADMLKVNLTTNEVIRLKVKNGMVEEYPQEINWNSFYNQLISKIHPDDRTDVIMKTHPSVLNTCPNGTTIPFSYRIKASENKNDYQYLHYSSSIRITVDDFGNRVATLLCIDNTQYLEERTRLKNISEKDELTYLYNRTKLEEMINTQYQNIESCGVLFFDVNNLKIVNDTKGHKAGDALICQAAESIRSISKRTVHAYRYGGDEFLVIAVNCTPAELNMMINLWEVRLQNLIADSHIPCSIALGKSWSKAPLSIQELISKADAAMYENKKMMKKKMKK